MKSDLKQTLRAAALATGWSMNRIAKATGLNYQTVHGFLTSDRAISIDSAARLAELLGLELRPARRRRKEG